MMMVRLARAARQVGPMQAARRLPGRSAQVAVAWRPHPASCRVRPGRHAVWPTGWQSPHAETLPATATGYRGPRIGPAGCETVPAPCASRGCARRRGARTSCPRRCRASPAAGHWPVRTARNACCDAGAAMQKRMKIHPSLSASRLWGRHGSTRCSKLADKPGFGGGGPGHPECEALGRTAAATRTANRHAACLPGRSPGPQIARRLRPLARRALITARPPRVFMRTRKPWVRLRRVTEGW